MERRKQSVAKPSELPLDYLSMLAEVFTTHFEPGLKIYEQTSPEPYFQATGWVFSDEIVLAVSLMNRGQLTATTVYASSDFDPKASSPTVQELLSACVDAVGSLFGDLLSEEQPKNIAQLADESLSALENVPFEWTSVDANRRQIYLKIDKSNPHLDALADEWLQKNDPRLVEDEVEKEKETEKLFVTGPSSRKTARNGTGTTH